ncbi:hypothetical protein AOLI_G00201600 [Acnodon oligacanthus]
MPGRCSRALGDKTQRRSALPSGRALTIRPELDGLSAGEHAALLTHFGSSLFILGRRSRVFGARGLSCSGGRCWACVAGRGGGEPTAPLQSQPGACRLPVKPVSTAVIGFKTASPLAEGKSAHFGGFQLRFVGDFSRIGSCQAVRAFEEPSFKGLLASELIVIGMDQVFVLRSYVSFSSSVAGYPFRAQACLHLSCKK